MPAKKARFYEVEARDGHGPYKMIIPASSKDDLMNNLNLPANEKLLGVKHLGFRPVDAMPDEDRGAVEFVAEVGGVPVVIGQGCQGHEYLKQQFPSKVKEVVGYYEEKYKDCEP